MKKTPAGELWELYQSIQLAPEQKAVAREHAAARAEQARVDGVYVRALEMAGTIQWSIPWYAVRMDE